MSENEESAAPEDLRNQQKGPEKNQGGRQPTFLFKDEFGNWEISRELKNFCDELESRHPNIKALINSYLINLISIASAQKIEYQSEQEHKKNYSFKEMPTSNIKNHEISLELFNMRRNRIIQICGLEALIILELYLGVDSKGVDAKDLRPFLGVDEETVKNLAHYLQFSKA